MDKMKFYTEEEALDRLLGVRGTPERESMKMILTIS